MKISSNFLEDNTKYLLLILELFLIFFYLILISLSIEFFPFNIILGIICLLFLPGYNLLNLIKPEFNLIQKLGYMTIISLAIDNVIMFFYYVLMYDIFTTPSNPIFFFSEFTIIIIQIFNIGEIILLYSKTLKFQTNSDLIFRVHKDQNKEIERIKNIDFLGLLFFTIFVISMFFLCFFTFFSGGKKYNYFTNYQFYQSNFAFFRRVPLIFYLYLFIAILSLIYIIFFLENIYLKVGSVSIFLYCLWILPYLQIGNYFDADSNILSVIIRNYFEHGIRADSSFSFLVWIEGPSPFRYSTSIFTTILLLIGTNTSLNFCLWYIYPIIYLFLPFFFYSIFLKYSNKKGQNRLDFIILTIIALLTPLTIKNEHTAETGVIGLLVFFILVIEFYELMKFRSFIFYKKNIILIIFLFFFLSLTHLEECVFFLLIIIVYGFYFLFTNNNKLKIHQKKFYITLEDKIEPIIDVQNRTKSNLRKSFILIFFLIFILALIFYLSQEFFGYIPDFFNLLSKNNNYFRILGRLYEDTKIVYLPTLNGSLKISLFILFILTMGVVILIISFYLLIFRFHDFILKMLRLISKYITKIYNVFKNHLLSKKFFQILIFPIFFLIILLLNSFYPFLEKQSYLLLTLELLLSYTILIFHIFLFINGILYYKFDNNKQNYFLIAIVSSTSLIGLLYITGNILFAFYILNARFFSYLAFFNLIIIQNLYFKKVMNLKITYLIILIFLLLSLGVFMSLRRLAFG